MIVYDTGVGKDVTEHVLGAVQNKLLYIVLVSSTSQRVYLTSDCYKVLDTRDSLQKCKINKKTSPYHQLHVFLIS